MQERETPAEKMAREMARAMVKDMARAMVREMARAMVKEMARAMVREMARTSGDGHGYLLQVSEPWLAAASAGGLCDSLKMFFLRSHVRYLVVAMRTF